MTGPLIYILAPFALAFVLFVVYLIVAIFLRDPARPFRMFKAPPLQGSQESTPRQDRGGEDEGPEGRPEKEQN